jgi:hypothetical protein
VWSGGPLPDYPLVAFDAKSGAEWAISHRKRTAEGSLNCDKVGSIAAASVLLRRVDVTYG